MVGLSLVVGGLRLMRGERSNGSWMFFFFEINFGPDFIIISILLNNFLLL